MEALPTFLGLTHISHPCPLNLLLFLHLVFFPLPTCQPQTHSKPFFPLSTIHCPLSSIFHSPSSITIHHSSFISTISTTVLKAFLPRSFSGLFQYIILPLLLPFWPSVLHHLTMMSPLPSLDHLWSKLPRRRSLRSSSVGLN